MPIARVFIQLYMLKANKKKLQTIKLFPSLCYETAEASLPAGGKAKHQENVGAWSKLVLNAPGPPRVVVVPVVHLVHSNPFCSIGTLFEILPKMWTRVDQGGPGGPGGL